MIGPMELLNDASSVMTRHDSRINSITKSVTDLNDFEVATLAILLDNTESTFDRFRKAKQLSDRTFSEEVGPFKRHAMDLVSTIFTTFDLRKLISIQPLKQKYGALYHMKYTYANTKGGVTAGASIFDPQSKPTYDGNYSSQWVKGETVAATHDGSSYEAALAYYPLSVPTEVVITISGGGAAGEYTVLDGTAAVWTIQKDAGGVVVGTLNPVTGALSIDAVADDATGIVATYVWNSEQAPATMIPRISVSVAETLVQARRRQLLFDVSLDTTFDFENQFGRDFMADVQASIVREIQNEIAFDVLSRMYEGADGNGGTSFTLNTANPTFGESLYDKAQENYKVLSAMSMQLYKNLGRGKGNQIVAGDDFIQYVEILGERVWKRNPGADERGPYYAGRLLDRYDVFHNPAMASDKFMMAYKGSQWHEAPFYLGSYLPVMASKYMLFPDMHGEQGYISMDAPHYMYPKHVAIGSVVSA